MSDTLITIITIFLSVVLLFMIPLMSIAERNNDISQSVAQTSVTETVSNVAKTGLIKRSDIDALRLKLDATGNTWDIEIEVKHLDENPGKKAVAVSHNLIGENLTYSTFTEEVMEKISNDDKYPLKKGDEVTIKVNNTNKTVAESFRTWMYKVVGNRVSEMSASSSAIVVNSGN